MSASGYAFAFAVKIRRAALPHLPLPWKIAPVAGAQQFDLARCAGVVPAPGITRSCLFGVPMSARELPFILFLRENSLFRFNW